MTPDRPLTVAQAADLLAVSTGTIYAACRSRQLAHFRLGLGRGAIRIERAALNAYKNRGYVPEILPAEPRGKVSRRASLPSRPSYL